MQFDEFCISDGDVSALITGLVMLGVLRITEDGIRAPSNITYSYIGPANHPDTGEPIPGVCALVSIDVERTPDAVAISAALDSKKIISTIPLRRMA